MSFIILMFLSGCTEVHEHETLTERLNVLEKKLEQHDVVLQRLKSAEVRTKNKKPLCSTEQPNAYVMSRSMLNEYLGDESTRPRVFPHQNEGEIVGLRLANVPEDWESCDLEDGDLLISIDGVQLRTPRTLQGIYERKSVVDQISLVRKRKGVDTTIRIRFVHR